MLPQDITFGSPRPRKDSAASVRMAEPASSVPVTMAGDTALRRMCLTMICSGLMQSERGLHVFALADAQRLRADQPGRLRPSS